MKLATRPALAAASMLMCLSLGTTACSDDGGGDGGGDTSSQPPLPSGQPNTFQIETTTKLGRVVGRLPKQKQKRLPHAITPVVQRWFDAAFVGGDYPRKNFRGAFPGFTPGARADALHDIKLMSNDDIGERISGVTPKVSQIWLDVLAVRTHAVAVTARFHLAFKTQGAVDRRVGVHGQVLLSRAKQGWRIFAYHVAKTGASA